jgi:hypothetical protein
VRDERGRGQGQQQHGLIVTTIIDNDKPAFHQAAASSPPIIDIANNPLLRVRRQ